ncbi:MAG: UDP-N-acetylglucosamine 4,6-dehydratase [Epsilonproteobacteria bacterium]|nr:MAG: UDP-N-acetylglucosamine 4,6-dehydratase [Campylobacterota bacterium]
MKHFLRPTSLKRIVFFVLFDIVLSLLTLKLAYNFRFNFDIPSYFLESFYLTFFVLIIFKIIFFYSFKIYFSVWRFFGFYEAKNMVKAHIFSYISFLGVYFLFSEYFAPFPRSVLMIDFFLSLIFLGSLRALKRLLLEHKYMEGVKPTLILGANSKASTMIQSALKGEIHYYPEAIIALEENESTKNTYINNVKVYQAEMLEKLVEDKDISSVIITEQLKPQTLHQLVQRLNRVGVTEIKQVKMLGSEQDKLEDLSIEDLLARHPKDLDLDLIENFIKDKSVLITGAGGSIGSEIARQCEIFGASSLFLLDNSEFNLYQIGEQIEGARLTLLSVTDKARLQSVFTELKPDIVIHAAAYKHVPLCEENQDMAVFNNVLGTKNVIDTSIENKVQKVIIVSTDKAVRPTNVMGTSKRVTELYASNVATKDTEIVAVRFGNVLGSSGSVIPKFKQQIEEGGPVTVTHPEITRYFMLIPEACQLVLQAAAMAKGGELFVLDMGEPIKIVDLARQMIRLYGKENEVEIVFTALRPGEKLYEELLIDESEAKTKYSSVFIAKPTKYDIEQLNDDIVTLLKAKDKIPALQNIVPEFTREN